MRLFVSAEKQIENVRKWNKSQEWGFEEEVLDRLTPSYRRTQVVTDRFPFTATVLVPYLKSGKVKALRNGSEVEGSPPRQKETSTEKTCIALVRLLVSMHPSLKDDLTNYAPTHLLANVDEPEPGFRWEMIDLGANLGHHPSNCIDRELSPHAGILAAACHFPEWVKRIESEELPGVWIVGYGDNNSVALFRNHDQRVVPEGQESVFWLGYAPTIGNNAGNRARKLFVVPRRRC